jgi:hypothetical protein
MALPEILDRAWKNAAVSEIYTAHPNSDWTVWVYGVIGTPAGNITFNWKGGGATGNVAYHATLATFVSNAQTAWDAKYGADTCVITGFVSANGNNGLKFTMEGAGLPGGILVATDPSTTGTSIIGALIEDAAAVFGKYNTNEVVAAAVAIYDDVTLPSDYLLWTIAASDPIAPVNVGIKTVRGLIAVPAGANVLVIASDPIPA